MTRRNVNTPTRTRFRRGVPDAEYTGACTCREFSGGRAVHNYGQPGCRYAGTSARR